MSNPALSAGRSGVRPPGPGFHGKAPGRGDFVARNLSRAFTDPWHGWLEQALPASRDALGERWRDAYLTCPAWRFALAPGVCGPCAAAGVFIPSVDKVGRYHPFAVVATLEDGAIAAALPATAGAWFAAAEDLALGVLDDAAAIDGLDARARDLGDPPFPRTLSGAAAPLAAAPVGLRLAADLGGDGDAGYFGLVERLLRARFGGYALWWTAGSERVPPSLLASAGLPPPPAFTAFLDGDWRRWGWNAAPDGEVHP